MMDAYHQHKHLKMVESEMKRKNETIKIQSMNLKKITDRKASTRNDRSLDKINLTSE